MFDVLGNVVFQTESSISKEYIIQNKSWILEQKRKVREYDLEFYSVESYDQLMNISQNKKNILRECVLKIILSIDEIKDIPLLIWLNGSYARNSNTIGSDIDLNFNYPNEYYSVMLPIEEYISIVLCEIFGLEYRDLIHPMGYSKLQMDYKINRLYDRKLILREGEYLPYKIRKNGLNIMGEYYGLSRDIEDIDNHFLSGFDNNPGQEWLYTREIIYSNHYSFNLFRIENHVFSSDFSSFFINIRKELQGCYERVKGASGLCIAEAKKYYRNKPLELFYLYAIFSSLPQKGNVICDISKANISKQLKDAYVRYRKQLVFYEDYLCKIGIEWSSHNREDYVDMLKNEFVELQSEMISFILSFLAEVKL